MLTIIMNTKELIMNKPNEKQKQWIADVAEWAVDGLEFLYGIECFEFQIHHVTGRSYIQNKVKIGHEFILPVPVHLHDVSSNSPLNVTHFPKAFTEQYGTQVALFNRMFESMMSQEYELPSNDVLLAIQSTNK